MNEEGREIRKEKRDREIREEKRDIYIRKEKRKGREGGRVREKANEEKGRKRKR